MIPSLVELAETYKSFNMETAVETRIAELETARSRIAARIENVLARDRERARRRETRSKIVLGAGVVCLARENGAFRLWLVNALRSKIAARDWTLIEDALNSVSKEDK